MKHTTRTLTDAEFEAWLQDPETQRQLNEQCRRLGIPDGVPLESVELTGTRITAINGRPVLQD